MPRFSIIIVSWNALHHLKTFLPGVADTHYADFEIILADNASADQSKQWVKKHYPAVKIITYNHNYGYCGGNNRAVAYTTGDILLFLNNDVNVEPDWLEPVGQLFNKNPDVAAVQPKIRSYENSEMFEYAGAAGGYIDRYGFPFCRGRLFDTLEKDDGQYDDKTDIFWASGAAFAIRKEIFRKLGGFDEDFEFHMEEIDLCWRLWNQGYKVAFCPDSVVYHLGGGSLPVDSPRKLYYNFRNGLIMMGKNYSTSSLIIRLPVRIALDGIAALRALIAGEASSFKAIIKAHWHFWQSLNKTLKKRKLLQKKRIKPKNPSIMKPINIIWQYFVLKKKYYSELPEEH